MPPQLHSTPAYPSHHTNTKISHLLFSDVSAIHYIPTHESYRYPQSALLHWAVSDENLSNTPDPKSTSDTADVHLTKYSVHQYGFPSWQNRNPLHPPLLHDKSPEIRYHTDLALPETSFSHPIPDHDRYVSKIHLHAPPRDRKSLP